MRQRLIKAAIFIVVFFVTLFIAGAVLNKGNTDMTVDMDPFSLPVVNMRVNGRDVNTLYGYTGDVQAKYMRDTLTPFASDKRFDIHIGESPLKVESLTYEVRSAGADRLVEKKDMYDLPDNGEGIDAGFNIKDLVEPHQEYLLTLTLHFSGGKKADYFTRIVWNDEADPSACLEFVEDFHQKTFDREKAAELARYLESNEEGDNSTFGRVNIHSGLSQVSWGDLKIKDRYYETIQIYDMDESLSSIGYEYIMDVEGREKDEKYKVREFYRLRYTAERIYLLDYLRTMDQMFDPEGTVFANDKIVLGITSDEVSITENTEGSAVVFSRCESLYEFRNEYSQLVRVFSFYDENNMSRQDLNEMHRIKALSVDEYGNLYFIVYGYMNRGRHEGEVGVCVFYYDSSRNYIEEKLYIPYDRSWEMLAEEVERLSFVNRNNCYFVCLNKTLFSIDLQTREKKILASDLSDDALMSSRNNRVVAFLGDEGKSIEVMDLGKSASRSIRAKEEETLTLVGFLGTDVVYGISDSRDMVRDRSGIVTMPMHTIKIEDKDGYERKDYYQENVYVINTSITGQTLHLGRVKKSGTGYRMMEEDQIIDNKKEEEKKNRIVKAVTGTKETVTQIALMTNVGTSIKLLTPREVESDGVNSVAIAKAEHGNEYYVYGSGRFDATFLKAYEAVNEAAGVNGVVLNDSMEYIWEKGNRLGRCELTDVDFRENVSDAQASPLARCLGAMLRHSVSDEKLQEALLAGETAIGLLKENYDGQVINLSGCELSSVLYYVSEKQPVLAQIADGKVVLIVGYDEKNTVILDPSTMTRYKKGMNDSKEWFEEGRNSFIVLK